MLASTLSLRAVGPATVLSHKCDILSLLKDDEIVRDNHLPVHCRHLASRRHHTVNVVTPLFAYPLFKRAHWSVPRGLDVSKTMALKGLDGDDHLVVYNVVRRG